MRISDWSSDVCSSDVQYRTVGTRRLPYWEAIKEYPTSCGDAGWSAVDHIQPLLAEFRRLGLPVLYPHVAPKNVDTDSGRSEEHTSELQSLMRISYAVFCLTKQLHPVTLNY